MKGRWQCIGIVNRWGNSFKMPYWFGIFIIVALFAATNAEGK